MPTHAAYIYLDEALVSVKSAPCFVLVMRCFKWGWHSWFSSRDCWLFVTIGCFLMPACWLFYKGIIFNILARKSCHSYWLSLGSVALLDPVEPPDNCGYMGICTAHIAYTPQVWTVSVRRQMSVTTPCYAERYWLRTAAERCILNPKHSIWSAGKQQLK